MTEHHDQVSEPLDRSSEIASRAAATGNGFDPLTQVLQAVRLSGALFFTWDVSWPFGTSVPAGRTFAPIVLPGAQEIVSYHIVAEGTAWAGLIGQPPVRLETGDILLVPCGDAYAMAHHSATCQRTALEIEPAMTFFRDMARGMLPPVVYEGGGGPERTRVICGFLGCDMQPFNPLLKAMPPLLRLPGGATGEVMQSLIAHALAETRHPRPGSQGVLARLSELLFIEVLRRCASESSGLESGWFAALRDPVVGRALALLHRDPSRAWTLDTLAAESCSSRSRLAECFVRLVGQPPMQYLMQWRMQLAAHMLRDGGVKVAAVARHVGYDSEAAFSRAFKRHLGLPPARWRRERRL